MAEAVIQEAARQVRRIYPFDSDDLRQEIERLLDDKEPEEILARGLAEIQIEREKVRRSQEAELGVARRARNLDRINLEANLGMRLRRNR
ncbi:MAG: hypothetical protein COX90_02940 [Candidatus Nealsonbacteria bacterium CG_4_10_14_0_2_um_filter_38_17]|uniref:Uncharacterized protein n=2 Tax=Candidatus Nealsoniibacteriota TaxID=1817911 RepID=A0A2M7UXR0_9BACT|nr:MAG: hypothetical protein COX36_03055 [Candidatus Nealsonbacteria bacterium CG23_combo_of_CG06-09_8_20_14_all_38_19]PIZ88764.1 MAG: hypothetical protein COX90_02940 [Candidatus Nealsonbacteria bacterium CG_4_10_14_0_2_um_filter_38_17]